MDEGETCRARAARARNLCGRRSSGLRLAGVLLSGCMAMGCQSALRGGVLVDPADVPRGTLVATYERVGCESSAGTGRVYVDFVQGVDGAPFIVERRRDGAWLIVTNHRAEGDEVVFRAVRTQDGRELREYRFSRDAKRSGRYAETRTFKEPRGTRHQFETRVLGTPLRCDLVRANPLTGVHLGSASEAEGDEAVDGNSVGPSSGWGYDGSSFGVGDRVLVEVGGRMMVAEVLQAPGDAYLVRFEGAPNGASTWIEPTRITGRLE